MKANEFKKSILDKLKKVYSKNSTLIILNSCKVENSTITVSDLDVEIKIFDPIFEGITGLIDMVNLTKVITKLKSREFHFEQDQENVFIVSEKMRIGLLSTIGENEDFPDPGKQDYKKSGTLTEEHCILLKKSLCFQGDDEIRVVMRYTVMEPDGHIAASDAHQLCFFKSKPVFKERTLLKEKTIQNIEPCQAYESENYLMFKYGNVTLTQKKYDGTYPSWKSVVPSENENVFDIDKKHFMENIEIATIQANSATKLMALHLSTEGCKLKSSEIEFNTKFESELTAKYTGKEMDIGFRSVFLLNILKNSDSDHVRIEIQDPNRGVIINGEFLLMPMILTD